MNDKNQSAILASQRKATEAFEKDEAPGLVLVRTPGQWIDVWIGGEHLQIKCRYVKSGQVSLKFVAPRSVKIVRREILGSVRDRAS